MSDKPISPLRQRMAPYGAATDQRFDHQRRHRRAVVLFQRDARTARPRPPSEDRDRAAQGAGRAQPGGGGAAPRSRPQPEVQGRAQRRLRALRRRSRSQRDCTTWAKMRGIIDRWLPSPRILHPWARIRFAVKHPRWEPDALIGSVRFCAGGAQQRASLPR
jgi:hypothetical protein